MFLPWRASPEDRSNKTVFDCRGGPPRRGGLWSDCGCQRWVSPPSARDSGSLLEREQRVPGSGLSRLRETGVCMTGPLLTADCGRASPLPLRLPPPHRRRRRRRIQQLVDFPKHLDWLIDASLFVCYLFCIQTVVPLKAIRTRNINFLYIHMNVT